MAASVLEVDELRVAFRGHRNDVSTVVNGVSFELGAEVLGVVGESGSGKSTVGRAIMGLLPQTARVGAERLVFSGQDLLAMPPAARARLRGCAMAMILQDPRHALHPTIMVGEQIAEACRLHLGLDRAAARHAAKERLADVAISDPDRVARLYPHQVSGGMGQRAMIAMMLVGNPRLLIADEPTSALDVSVRQGILDLLCGLVKDRGISLMLISHDINVVRRTCDRVLVMYRGRLVETLARGELASPRHPYTQGLVAALPSLRAPRPRLPVLDHNPEWAG